MKAVVLQSPGSLRLADVAPPGELGSNQALVRVHRVGICGSDLHAFEGTQNYVTYPRIIGHELGVEIVEMGSAGAESDLTVGDLCAVQPYLSCGRCIACRRGKPNCCVNLDVLGVHRDGGMQEVMIVPLEKLHASEVLSAESLALVEMLSVGAHAVERAELEPSDTVLIVGAGPIGLSVAEFASLSDATVIIAEVDESRLEFCQEHAAARLCLDAAEDLLPQLREAFSGDLPTAVFDATGSARSMRAAFRYVAPGGRLILVGHVPGEIAFRDPDFHSRELTLLASRNATRSDFGSVIDVLESGRIDVGSWVTHVVSPEEITQEFEHWLDPRSGVFKALLRF